MKNNFIKFLNNSFFVKVNGINFYVYNGREFKNKHVDSLSAEYDIVYLSGKSYNLQSQGRIERFNGKIKKRLRSVSGINMRWIDHSD